MSSTFPYFHSGNNEHNNYPNRPSAASHSHATPIIPFSPSSGAYPPPYQLHHMTSNNAAEFFQAGMKHSQSMTMNNPHGVPAAARMHKSSSSASYSMLNNGGQVQGHPQHQPGDDRQSNSHTATHHHNNGYHNGHNSSLDNGGSSFENESVCGSQHPAQYDSDNLSLNSIPRSNSAASHNPRRQLERTPEMDANSFRDTDSLNSSVMGAASTPIRVGQEGLRKKSSSKKKKFLQKVFQKKDKKSL